MLEKIGQSAETLVRRVSLSRRGFLGRAAKVAAGLGAVLAGCTAFPSEAQTRSVREHRSGRCPNGGTPHLFCCDDAGVCYNPGAYGTNRCSPGYHKEWFCY